MPLTKLDLFIVFSYKSLKAGEFRMTLEVIATNGTNR